MRNPEDCPRKSRDEIHPTEQVQTAHIAAKLCTCSEKAGQRILDCGEGSTWIVLVGLTGSKMEILMEKLVNAKWQVVTPILSRATSWEMFSQT